MQSIQERINAVQSPVAKELLQGLHDELSSLIVIPNKLLPVELQNKKTGGRTCREASRMFDKIHSAEIESDDREFRIQKYMNDMETTGKIEYLPMAVSKRKKRVLKLS